jgi:hypothetical protein
MPMSDLGFFRGLRQHQARMTAEGRCVQCGAEFLYGRENGEVTEEGKPPYLMCFFCWDALEYDPFDYRPQLSQFHYGHC